MKQKDWFWCGAALFVLAMFVTLQSFQAPLYSGIAGGLCVLAAVLFFGCGLWANAQERSVIESKRLEEEQDRLKEWHQIHTEGLERIQSIFEAMDSEIQSVRTSTENEGRRQRECMTAVLNYLREWFDAQQQSYTVALSQIHTDLSVVTGEIQALRKTISSEHQLHSQAFVQLSKDVRECSASDRAQTKESTKSICDSILEQHTALHKMLDSQGKESVNYYKFMIEQPWAKVGSLSQTLQSIADQVDNVLSAIDSIQSGTEKQLKKALDKLKTDSESLQEKLQYVCETLEKQGKESRDAMDRVIQGYSDITAQDVEVLTALARDVRE